WAHVEIAGEIVQGDVQKLRKALEEATTRAIETYAPIVIINSQGGSVSVSLEMGKVLRDYHANTVVDGNGTCSSSCIFVFAGGVMRDLFSNGRFGLHRPRFDYEQFSNLPEDQARAAYETLSSACADFMRRMGITERVPPGALTLCRSFCAGESGRAADRPGVARRRRDCRFFLKSRGVEQCALRGRAGCFRHE